MVHGQSCTNDRRNVVDTAQAQRSQIRLPWNWFRIEFARGVNPEKRGLYEWHIAGVGSYIGQYSHYKRPWVRYTKNVQNLLNGMPYHIRGQCYRTIHKELAKAFKEGRVITLTFLKNEANKARRNSSEARLIEKSGSLNDPPFNKRTN